MSTVVQASAATARRPQQAFQFIDNNDMTMLDSISTQIRRHVMQEYMRKKRWETRDPPADEVPDGENPDSEPTQASLDPSETQNGDGLLSLMTTKAHRSTNGSRSPRDSPRVAERSRSHDPPQALRVLQAIRAHTCPPAASNTQSSQLTFLWMYYTSSTFDKDVNASFHDVLHAPSPDIAQFPGQQQLSQHWDEFITFLQCTEHLALVYAGLARNSVYPKRQPMRFGAFAVDAPLGRSLARFNIAPEARPGPLKHDMTRLAVLVTINTAIWEYRHSELDVEAFLTSLVHKVVQKRLDESPCIETLLQVLLEESFASSQSDNERPWLVARVLRVAKRLSRASVEKLNEVLSSFLVLPSGLQPAIEEWKDTLSNDVLHAPSLA